MPPVDLELGTPCIVCRGPLRNFAEAGKGNQPLSGVEFTSRGHYGSAVHDPMDASELAFNICDPCLKEAIEDHIVHQVTSPTQHQKYKLL